MLVLVGCGSTPAPDSKKPTDNDTSAEATEPDPDTDGTPAPDSGSGDSAEEACADAPWTQMVPGEPIETPAGEGVSLEEALGVDAFAHAVLADEYVGAVFWREQGTNRYQVQSAEQSGTFTRERNGEGDWQLAWLDASPLGDDPMADSVLSDALSHGNPRDTSYPDLGYETGDPRLSFPALGDASFPSLMPRIAQLFDSPNAPDLGVILAPYASGGRGSHGDMSVAQSRAPLAFRGPGVVPGLHALTAHTVDIAPTVAGLLGVEPVLGVNGETGRWTEGVFLARQDGHVLTEVLTPTCAYGAAARAVVIILDGLSHTELLDGIEAGRYPNLARIAGEEGAVLSGGSIVGWPSFSLPGHVSIHTGAWPGHHGMVSNGFRDRALDQDAPGEALQDILADAEAGRRAMDAYLSADVETVYEAVARTSPGALTASINELAFRGATWGFHVSTEGPPPPSEGLTEYAIADETAVLQVAHLFESEGPPVYLAVSLYLPDGAGQNYGPHGDSTREALADTDERVGRILDIYEAAGVFDETVFVLTADHGMELQDSLRTSGWSTALSAVGLPSFTYGRMVYLR